MRSVRQKTLRLALSGAVVFGAVSCDDADEKVLKGSGNKETKPVSTLLGELKNAGDALADAPPTPVVHVDYLINITTGSADAATAKDDDTLCNGEFAADVLSDFTFKLPSATIQCLGLTVDIAGLLNAGSPNGLGGGAGAGSGSIGDQIKNVSHDGYVLELKSLMGATFSPARPVLLGPIVQNADKYKDFKREYPTTLSGDSGGQHYEKTGKFTVQVLDNKATYSNSEIAKSSAQKLEHVIHWQMDAEGFDVPATLGGAVDHLEFWYNTYDPIMIPHIIVRGKLLKGFLKGDSAKFENFIDDIKVEVIVKSFKIL